jgi:DNA excision repair protein ERCC-2
MAPDDSPDTPTPPTPPMAEEPKPDEIREAGAGADGVETVPLDSVDANWTDYFRYGAAYRDQVDAIDTFLELLADNGLYLLEGACGTGKTLVAATAGLHAIRDQSHLSDTRCDSGTSFPEYSRLLVVTPVKQQLKQFVEEMRGVNQSLPDGTDSVPTVVMRGRGDMLPYSNVTLESIGGGPLGDQADDLRDMTRTVIRFNSNIPLDWPADMDPPEFSQHDYDWDDAGDDAEQMREGYRYDPWRAEAVTRIVADLANEDTAFDRLTVDSIETPYPDYVPHTTDLVADDGFDDSAFDQLPLDLQGKFDPFYAGFFAGEPGPLFDFELAPDAVFDRDALFEAAASRGICPHETMVEFAKSAEVVLGNYNHLFDPQTRMLTDEKAGLIDNETITVVDEAHQIESRVRDMLSDELDLYSLQKAVADVTIARDLAVGDHEYTPLDLGATEQRRARTITNRALETAGTYSVDVEDLNDVESLLRFTMQKIGEYGAEKLADQYDDIGWRGALNNWGGDRLEESLSEPDTVTATDRFTEDVTARQHSEESFYDVYRVMLALRFVYDRLREEGLYDREPQGVGVGRFFKRWVVADRVEYHRQVVLEPRPKESPPEEFPEWVEGWTPKLTLFNCIPCDELRGVFGKIGGGVLMSATIQPANVFKEAVGIDAVPYPDDDDETDSSPSDALRSSITRPDPTTLTDAEIRPTDFEQYPLRFPYENRLSMTVDLPKYTYRNRGQPTQDVPEMTNVRQEYIALIIDVVQSPGNVLIAMPNYEEAKWAYEFAAGQNVDKRLHLDQSSGSQQTTKTLNAFFDSGPAAIFTSALGTITEGVDYDGGKLHACAAVGIPLKPTNQPRTQAIKTAYDERLSSYSGFESALTVPAVRKVRQAIGRVIRGPGETGVRLLIDERYNSNGWSGVKEHLSEQEQAEFAIGGADQVDQEIQRFWTEVGSPDTSVAATANPRNMRIDGADGELGGQTAETPAPGSGTDASGTGGATTTEAQGGDTGGADDSTEPSNSDQTEVKTEKVYFGDGSALGGWTEMPTVVIEETIIPIVENHTVPEERVSEEAAPNVIKLNFTKGLSMGGWTNVRADVVTNRIEEIAQETRID